MALPLIGICQYNYMYETSTLAAVSEYDKSKVGLILNSNATDEMLLFEMYIYNILIFTIDV